MKSKWVGGGAGSEGNSVDSLLECVQGGLFCFMSLFSASAFGYQLVLRWAILRPSLTTCFFVLRIKGWSGGAKVSCILCHQGVQLILAYIWARPAIVVVGKGGGRMFLFLLFLPFRSCSSFFPVPLFHLFYYLFYLFSPFLWETTQNDPQGLTCR